MSDFEPRTNSNGIRYAKYWYSENPFYQTDPADLGLPNCTCYAWGRFWEAGGPEPEKRPRLSLSDAKNWFDFTEDRYERGQDPQEGAVICWTNPRYGHVAIVEKITNDSIFISESAWGGFFFNYREIPRNGQYPISDYRLEGYIYNPYSGGHVTPGGGGVIDNKLFLFKRMMDKKKGYRWQ